MVSLNGLNGLNGRPAGRLADSVGECCHLAVAVKSDMPATIPDAENLPS